MWRAPLIAYSASRLHFLEIQMLLMWLRAGQPHAQLQGWALIGLNLGIPFPCLWLIQEFRSKPINSGHFPVNGFSPVGGCETYIGRITLKGRNFIPWLGCGGSLLLIGYMICWISLIGTIKHVASITMRSQKPSSNHKRNSILTWRWTPDKLVLDDQIQLLD